MEYPTTVTYRGVIYKRNPKAKQRAHRVYYNAPRGSDRDTLHRDIYRDHHGQIPDGWHVHHVDENPLNNHPSNLVALSPADHANVHPGDIDRRSPEWLAHLDEIRPLAAEWHSSPEGIAWHSENGARTWDEREAQPIEIPCASCGGEISTHFANRGELRFCSRRCINAHTDKSGRYDKPADCPICGNEFMQRRGRPKTCGPKCGTTLGHRSRKVTD